MRKASALAGAVVLVFAALAAFTACRSTPNGGARGSTPTAGRPSPGATPSPRPTATPAVTPMPVTTPAGASRYDREPGVLYEETGPTPVAPSGTPTRPAAPATRTPSPR
jgi:hypothetical protein